jgi:hypothetical protein
MRLGITGHRGLPEGPEGREGPVGHEGRELAPVGAVGAVGAVGVAQSVRAAIDGAVRGYSVHGLVGVSCIADGPDTWFAQSVLDHGGLLEVVVPAREYRASLPEWHRPMYDALLQRAADIHRTGFTSPDPEAYMAGSEVMLGIVDELLAVWDGLPARGYGGTADVVAYARSTGVPVRLIWPEGASRD